MRTPGPVIFEKDPLLTALPKLLPEGEGGRARSMSIRRGRSAVVREEGGVGMVVVELMDHCRKS